MNNPAIRDGKFYETANIILASCPICKRSGVLIASPMVTFEKKDNKGNWITYYRCLACLNLLTLGSIGLKKVRERK